MAVRPRPVPVPFGPRGLSFRAVRGGARKEKDMRNPVRKLREDFSRPVDKLTAAVTRINDRISGLIALMLAVALLLMIRSA